LTTRIVAVVEALRDHPYLGRAGAEPGVRELPIGGTPYIVLYRVVRGKRVTAKTIWHGHSDGAVRAAASVIRSDGQENA